MATLYRRAVQASKTEFRKKSRASGWVLPKQTTSFADRDRWSNIDSDVTPLERRTWTSWTILGFWISDCMNAQGWQAPSSIMAIGLTWREAVYCIILGSTIDTIPLILNGVIGASLHVPFPVAARSAFGFYFARFAVVIRMVTALFWHAIQTYTGSTAITQCIRVIWPSYLDIPNTLPASAGITSQQLISHVLFWSIQLPFLLTPPHKLKWFFMFKAVVVFSVCVATVVYMIKLAGGASGGLWDQPYKIDGSARSWAILSSMMSITGGWATMATNVPDFTRYLRTEKGVYWQGPFLPIMSLIVGIFGILSTSASKKVYGEYIWDPIALAARFESPGGKALAFFIGFGWCVAQIGTNLSANVISFANDAVSLSPKYISIRRGVLICTVTAGYLMVPWKIISSAESLLTFMSGLAIFLCPIAALLASDYWIVKRRHIDVPSLYRRHARYRYRHGINWRAAVAMLVSLVPNIPGLAKAVSPSVKLGEGIRHIYDMNYLYGFSSAVVVYCTLSWIWPARDTLLSASIFEDVVVIDGIEHVNDGIHSPIPDEDLDEKLKTYEEVRAFTENQ